MENNNIVLLLGGNIGDTRGYLRNALTLLEQYMGFITHQSYFYKTASWGYNSDDFINIGLVIETSKSAEECLIITQDIEDELGRIKEETSDAYSDRTLDIDIIFYNNLVLKSEKLTIPHPRMHERNFVLQPLAEMIPEFEHPVLKKTISELTKNCTDTSKATLLNEQV
jgi:2-amino-4-hydroxy-6-hydroxymethyldihydropteridine diphosphokinase